MFLFGFCFAKIVKNSAFLVFSVGKKWLFWFFEALAFVSAKTKCAICAVG
jgi:hypothetical protein